MLNNNVKLKGNRGGSEFTLDIQGEDPHQKNNNINVHCPAVAVCPHAKVSLGKLGQDIETQIAL